MMILIIIILIFFLLGFTGFQFRCAPHHLEQIQTLSKCLCLTQNIIAIVPKSCNISDFKKKMPISNILYIVRMHTAMAKVYGSCSMFSLHLMSYAKLVTI